jgi:hypothetical protein
VEDVEDSVEVLGFVDGGDVGGLFDDANQALVAGCAGAVNAGIDVGDVVADGAETQIGFNVADGGRKSLGVVVTGAEDVEGETLRAFCAYAGELFELIDEARHGFGKFRHGDEGIE